MGRVGLDRGLRGARKNGVVCGVGQERLGLSYFFISLVLGPLNSLLWYVPSSRYIRSSAPILFLQEQIKDIIISNTRRSINRTHLCRLRHTYGGDALRLELVRQVRDQKRLSLQRLQTHVHTHSFTSYVHMYITGCTVLPRDTGSRGSAQQHSRRKDGGERESLTNRYLIHIVAHEIVDIHEGLHSRVL